jgi:hypothetical protein
VGGGDINNGPRPAPLGGDGGDPGGNPDTPDRSGGIPLQGGGGSSGGDGGDPGGNPNPPTDE